MARFIDILRFTIISWELVFILVAFSICTYYPEFFSIVGSKIQGNDEIWKYLPVLPLAFSGVTFKSSAKLRAPLENTTNKPLYDWGSYHKIVDRIIASYIISILCCCAVFTIWIFSKELSPVICGMLFITSVVISGVTALQIFIASHKVREVIEQYM
ncbi:hypothetical protein [Photobacterium sanguinicancri]|uniref:hypothetical protein n=1 Tax=Photobacterium sanguinicancri TaxID=875932 RepID=UPI003D14FF5F